MQEDALLSKPKLGIHLRKFYEVLMLFLQSLL